MEFLIRINSWSERKRFQRGHVIAAKPDGWSWSDREKNNPDWVIVRAGVSKTEVDLLTSPSKSGVSNPKVREKKLDLDAMGVIPGNDVQIRVESSFVPYMKDS